MNMRRTVLAGLLLSLVTVSSVHAQSRRIEGIVRDTTGAPIAGAAVIVHVGDVTVHGFTAHTSTDNTGNFSFSNVPDGTGTVDVSADGFAPVHLDVGPGTPPALAVVLHPAAVREQVIVSATRTQVRLSEAPGSTVRLSATDVAATPALMVDDMLRQVPGFTLFRRTGSRTANPTSQGVSLRGMGASGASRALVLMDGIPLLDPFGGWVYWDRIPRAEIESVEVFRGGLSSLY